MPAIELIVPFPADGVTDLVARRFAHALSRHWQQAVSVRNVAGAGGTTGTLQLIAAAPDGATMMMSATGQATQNPAIDSALPYRWDSVTPVARVSASALALVVRGGSRWTSLAELLAHVRSAPQAHRIGTSGGGGASILALARLLDAGGIDLKALGTLTFHGGAAILEAVITRQTDFAAQYVAEMGPLLADARLRALAVSGQSRTAALPEVPTAAECGFAGFDLLGWTGVVGPPGLPAAIVERWQAAVQAVAAAPEFRAEIEALGGSVAWLDHVDFRQALAAEYAIARDTVERLGLRR
jgi:tripartite-type tricarboxylate transporter receptor subunit TctC